jgi:hypothetical protein
MPPVKYAPGTKSASTPSEYTDAQWNALEALKQTEPKLKFGAARPEFMNKIMLIDGTLNDDHDAVKAACAAADAADIVRLNEFLSANGDAVLHDTLDAAQRRELVNLRHHAKHNLVEEFEDHVNQQRFLFIVDADLVPRIYFQCAVPENPDVELADDADAE